MDRDATDYDGPMSRLAALRCMLPGGGGLDALQVAEHSQCPTFGFPFSILSAASTSRVSGWR